MSKLLRVLVVEDSEDDTLLIVRELERHGYDIIFERVDKPRAFNAALASQTWDVILADYVMPEFSGLAALELVQETGHDIPFIIVSGKIGEDTAVAAMKAGAHDYIMKDSLARLAPAIKREICEAEIRRQNKRAAERERENHALLSALLEALPDAIFAKDCEGRYLLINSAGALMLAKSKEAIVGKTDKEIAPELAPEIIKADREVMTSGESHTSEVEVEIQGSLWTYMSKKTVIRNQLGNITGIVGISHDITRRKQEMEKLRQRTHDLGKRVKELTCLYSISNFINKQGVSLDEIFQGVVDFIPPAYQYPEITCARIIFEDQAYKTSNFDETVWRLESDITVESKLAGKLEVCYLEEKPEIDEGPYLKEERELINAITELLGRTISHKQANEALIESEKSLAMAQRITHLGNWDWDIQRNEMYWSDEVYRIFGVEVQAFPPSYDAFLSTVHPDDREFVEESVNKALDERKPVSSIDHRIVLPDGSERIVHEDAELTFEGGGKPVRMVGTVHDITEVREKQEELRQSYGKLQKAMHGTIHAIGLTVEMRDPYTAGHQRRVSQLACAIAREMSLPEEQIKGLHTGGLVHDIGKISIPADILSKPGGLSKTEFALFKDHPQVGYEILKGIEFPWPVASMILQHHEKMDGSGYPEGLSGDEIILEARILLVSDVVEAMCSHRPYRPALGMDKALEEIAKNTGVLYDYDVANACLRLFNEKGFEFEEMKKAAP